MLILVQKKKRPGSTSFISMHLSFQIHQLAIIYYFEHTNHNIHPEFELVKQN